MKRLLRKVFVRASSLFGIPEIQARLDRVELSQNSLRTDTESSASALAGHVDRRLSDISGAIQFQVKAQADHFENRLTSLNDALVRHIDGKQALVDTKHSEIDSALEESRHQISQELGSFRQALDTVRRRVETGAGSSSSVSTPSSPVEHGALIDDSLYVSLENHFRGSRDLVAERQATYIPHLPTVITENTPLVDLGCGRGEWLIVLRQHGVPALGIDSNSVAIAECSEAGLNAERGDLLGFLRARPDASVGAFTLFQVLEHLPFPVLLETMREMRRTLVPGGKVIAEVPNAKNLRVSAGTFWIDPTHQRPLYPEFLQFLAQEVGFSSSEALYVNNDSPQLDLSGLPDGARIALERVLEAIDTARDFALVATA